jgi:hypothetical protein
MQVVQDPVCLGKVFPEPMAVDLVVPVVVVAEHQSQAGLWLDTTAAMAAMAAAGLTAQPMPVVAVAHTVVVDLVVAHRAKPMLVRANLVRVEPTPVVVVEQEIQRAVIQAAVADLVLS